MLTVMLIGVKKCFQFVASTICIGRRGIGHHAHTMLKARNISSVKKDGIKQNHLWHCASRTSTRVHCPTMVSSFSFSSDTVCLHRCYRRAGLR